MNRGDHLFSTKVLSSLLVNLMTAIFGFLMPSSSQRPLVQSQPVEKARYSCLGLTLMAVPAPPVLLACVTVLSLVFLTTLQMAISSLPAQTRKCWWLQQPRSSELTCPKQVLFLMVCFCTRAMQWLVISIFALQVSLKSKVKLRPSIVPSTATLFAEFMLDDMNFEKRQICTLLQSPAEGFVMLGRFFMFRIRTVFQTDPISRLGKSKLQVTVFRGSSMTMGEDCPVTSQNLIKLSKPSDIMAPFSSTQNSPQMGASWLPRATMFPVRISMATTSPEASPAKRMPWGLMSMARTGWWRKYSHPLVSSLLLLLLLQVLLLLQLPVACRQYMRTKPSQEAAKKMFSLVLNRSQTMALTVSLGWSASLGLISGVQLRLLLQLQLFMFDYIQFASGCSYA